MKIFVKAKPKARVEKVELLSQEALNFDGKKGEPAIYKVSVKEPPVGGRANQAIIKALANYFDVSLSGVKLISGHSSRLKVFEIQ